ncbi:uncharacterized protein KGF55_002812 [Candida pseudojiufengensis]|uniref:uncharacterized protein n=1 Tax=Candida pseudojiufengensis TaxID=497109 RepID=UPI0022249373|nr:uncharacterized protein KGF55_002812 [Candida pseudojiufengensis]KAI5963020.1 hypothetical protein KGF55_002812 [Candida pseudojiufengensis]
MAPKARAELVVPYRHVPAKARKDAGNIISQSLPMAAMFMKNKMLSWAALFLSIQSYLNEPINKEAEDGAQPPILKIVFALVAVLTCYIDVIFPQTNPTIKKAAQVATETIVSTAT